MKLLPENMNKKQQKTAFSLIELSIVLVIVAILITGALSVSITGINNAKARVTNERIGAIYKAMGKFLLTNYRLPCPASILLTKTSTNYGKEVGSEGGCSGSGVFASNTVSDLVYGMVPVNALGLPSEMGEDGFGSKFAYVIHKQFTDADYPSTSTPSPTGFSFTSATDADLLKIYEMPSENILNDVVFAIISHGANKSGAYNATSSAQNTASSDGYEQQNYLSSTDDSGHTADFGEIGGSYTSNVVITAANTNSDIFDDVVFFKQKNDLIADFDTMFLTPCLGTDAGAGYSNVYFGQTKFRSSACATPSDETPSKKCGANGVWNTVRTCVSY